MKMKNVLLVLLALSTLAGCKQDPLEDYSDSIRNAKPPGKKPSTKTDADALLIDVNDFYNVREGEEIKFQITGRVLEKNLGHQIVIENPQDFPGMSYEPRTGKFVWTAPNDYVKKGRDIVIPLKVLMKTTGGTEMIRRKEVHILVLRQFLGPEVLSVNSLDEMIEGQTDTFTVTVKSPDEVSEPSIAVVLNRNGVQDGAAYVAIDRSVAKNPTQSTVDPSMWTFYMMTDLTGAEVTSGTDDMFFGLQAFSSNGVASAVKSFSYRVKTNIEPARTSWIEEKVFEAGVKTNVSFQVYDPRDEGRVTASIPAFNCSSLPGATCNCRTVRRSEMECTISWTAPQSMIGRQIRVNYDTQNASTAPNDTRVQSKTFSGYVRVVEAAP